MSESSEKESSRCPSCGAEIPREAPGGLCPRCVLEGVAGEAAATAAATRTAAAMGMQAPTLEEIAVAFPQFEVIEMIGSGGMGAVFKVRQPRLDRMVALKVLPRSLAGDARFTERFTREARALAKLNHPNIVAVHDFGESGGFHFLLMEFVDGANLREAMRAGRFTPEQAFGVVPKICSALQYAHDEGVLHRDIKPENLLLDASGRVKIVDFGIAKLVSADDDVSPVLTGSMAPGTPQYMAPEQIEHPSTVDHRADIYSLGVVFYEMLTGELPIGRFAAPSEKARVGGEVDDIVFRTLEKEPDRRQQSAGEVRTQVEGIADTPPPPLSGSQSQSQSQAPSPAAAHPGHHANARTDNSRRAGHALLLLSVSVVVMLLVWSGGVFLSEHYDHRERVVSAVKHAEADNLQAKAAKWQAEARAMRQRGERGTESDRLEAEAEATMQQVFELHRSARSSNQPNGVMLGMLILCIAVSIVFGVLIIEATVRGWKTLRALRMSGEKRGRISALIAALLLPTLAISASVLVIFLVPARGTWVGPAISLSVIGSLVANLWLGMGTWRWLKTPPTAEEKAAYQRSLAATAGHQGRRAWRWVAALLAVALLVFAGLVVIRQFRNQELAQAAAADATAAVAAARKAQDLAEAHAVGKELSSEELQIVGSWHFDQGLDVGDFHFSADRKWRMETADGNLKMSGTWQVVEGVLEKEVVESSESEQVGVTIRSDIIELIDEEMLVIRDRKGGDELTLYSSHAMPSLEDQLLGSWRPPVSDQEELIIFVSDHTFRFITSRAGTLVGTWRLSGDGERLNMFVRDAPAGGVSDINFGADFAKVSRDRIEFDTPLYGNETVLEKVVQVDLSSEAVKLLGHWEFLDRGERGKCIFYADGSYRSEAVGQWEQATWRRDGEHLELTVTASSHEGLIGKVQRVDIVSDFDGERLLLRDEGAAAIIELRPFHPLSDSEQSLVGNWRPLEADKEENFEFWADRRFKVITPEGLDEGYWRIYDDGSGEILEMVMLSRNEEARRGVALRGKVLILDEKRFEFAYSDGEGSKILERVATPVENPDPQPNEEAID